MLTDEEMHERMVNGWRAGKPETVCGNGSTSANTKNVRAWLPQVVERYGIQRLNDAGAGDLAWIKKVSWNRPIAYKAYDLIPRDPAVTKIDITTESMPWSDAVLCRMVLNHLDEPRILMALGHIRKRTSYLIATQFNGKDLPQRSAQFMRLDLMKAPYSLGEPLERCQDGSEQSCSLAIWRL